MKHSLVFFGSGPVAAKSLQLLKEHQIIEAVITKPTTVDELSAVAGDGIPVYTVTDRKELDTLVRKQHFTSSMGVLIDFGIIVSQNVIDTFKLGIINSHFSILPEWRGADPISFAILSGQAMTGVSLMIVTSGMDEGPIIGYGEQPLTGIENGPQLTDMLINLSDSLLRHELGIRFEKPTPGFSQTITGRTKSYSRKLTKQDGLIDWEQPAHELEREIRAFLEWPKSRTNLGGKDVIITAAHTIAVNNPSLQPGDINQSQLKTGELVIQTGDESLSIDSIKPNGKKEMPVQAFLMGYRQLLQ